MPKQKRRLPILGSRLFIFSQCFARGSFAAVHPQFDFTEFIGKTRSVLRPVIQKVCCQGRKRFPFLDLLAARKMEHEKPSPLGAESVA